MTTAIVSLLLGAAVKLLLGWLNDRRAEAALREAGAATTASNLNKEAADAQRRAADAAINTSRGTDADDDLESGRRPI